MGPEAFLPNDVIMSAAHAVANVVGVEADPKAILEDAFLLSLAFPDEDVYLCAVANTVRALNLLVNDSVSVSQLKYNHDGWFSYHYQHKVEQGSRADMRIVFRKAGNALRLRAFGHRNMSIDFYDVFHWDSRKIVRGKHRVQGRCVQPVARDDTLPQPLRTR